MAACRRGPARARRAQRFRELDTKRWREGGECEGGDASRGGARGAERLQDGRDQGEKQRAESAFGLEQEDAGAGNDENEQERAVRPEMAEIVEMIAALPERVKDQEQGERQ